MKMTCNIHPSIFVYITSTALKRSQFVYGRWYPTRDIAKLQNWLLGIKLGRIENIQRSWKLVFSSFSTHQNYKKYGFSVAKRRAVAKLEKNICKLLQALMLRQIAWLKLCRPAGMQKDKFVYCREHQAASRIKVITLLWECIWKNP